MDQSTAELYALAVAALAGSLMAWQGGVNSLLQREVNLMPATLLVHLIGTVTAAAVVGYRLFRETESFHLAQLAEAPLYSYLGGILSVAIIGAVAYSIATSGAALATTAIIVGQVLTAALIDHLGLFRLREVSFSLHRLAGVVLLAAGAWFLLKSS